MKDNRMQDSDLDKIKKFIDVDKFYARLMRTGDKEILELMLKLAYNLGQHNQIVTGLARIEEKIHDNPTK
jgi:RecJ-like exonuclease